MVTDELLKRFLAKIIIQFYILQTKFSLLNLRICSLYKLLPFISDCGIWNNFSLIAPSGGSSEQLKQQNKRKKTKVFLHVTILN